MNLTKTTLRTGLLVCIALFAAGSSKAAVFTDNGANPAAIQTTVDSFRSALGNLNPNVAGSVGSGRREINWDGVPDAFSSPNNLPANFFNVNSPRGVVMSTPGTGFMVSATSAAGPVRFDNLNATYSALFQTFSAQRLFTAINSNTVQIDFFVPGSNTPAIVSGFGAVFADVNTAGGTKFTVTLGNGTSGGQFTVPTGPAGGLSFLGLTDPLGYSRIVIQSGNSALGPNQNVAGGIDVVAMDDFIFGEPNAVIPEPSSLLLTSLGAFAILMGRQRKI